MSRRESVEFVNMCLIKNGDKCMIKNGDKVLVQDRVSPDWPGITFPGGSTIIFLIFMAPFIDINS